MGTLLSHPFSTTHISQHLDPGQKKRDVFCSVVSQNLVSAYCLIYHGKTDAYIKKILDKEGTFIHTEV